ncbi:MAG: N-acetyltransferase [Candidatus Eisenbacteria sp.]|nr:N-acetyltransferase [Candidatus Eisenbacteria bacterium]
MNMVIEGKLVRLRDVEPDDFGRHKRWWRPGAVWQNWDAPWEMKRMLNPESIEHWLTRLREPPPSPRQIMQIETRDGEHIGWVGTYWVSQETGWRDCGVVIAEEEHWGHGYGQEAFRLWVDYLIDAHQLTRIGIGTWGGNERMIHLAARVGMHEEARFPEARVVEQRRCDAVRWGMTRAEWQADRAPAREGFRPYRSADWPRAVELIRQLFQYHRTLQEAPEFILDEARETLFGWLRRREDPIWVWQEGGELAALAQGRHAGAIFLEAFVVAEGRRGQGLGARFLEAIETHLKERGEQDLFLSMVWPGNPGAIDFYRRHGYDLLNTFELRKGLTQDRRGRKIRFLGRSFHLGKSVP